MTRVLNFHKVGFKQAIFYGVILSWLIEIFGQPLLALDALVRLILGLIPSIATGYLSPKKHISAGILTALLSGIPPSLIVLIISAIAVSSDIINDPIHSQDHLIFYGQWLSSGLIVVVLGAIGGLIGKRLREKK